MKIIKSGHAAKVGTVTLSLLLFGLGGCGGSDGVEAIASEKPPLHSNSPHNEGAGASIGVSNLCWVDVATATLYVETTITNKSLGKEVPHFLGVEMQPLQKVKRSEYPLGPAVAANVDLETLNAVDAADSDTGQYAPFITEVDLCASGLMTNATSVNANLRVELYNSNNTYTNSMCTARDENGLKIGGLGLCQ